jgi:hypothetical protein
MQSEKLDYETPKPPSLSEGGCILICLAIFLAVILGALLIAYRSMRDFN